MSRFHSKLCGTDFLQRLKITDTSFLCIFLFCFETITWQPLVTGFTDTARHVEKNTFQRSNQFYCSFLTLCFWYSRLDINGSLWVGQFVCHLPFQRSNFLRTEQVLCVRPRFVKPPPSVKRSPSSHPVENSQPVLKDTNTENHFLCIKYIVSGDWDLKSRWGGVDSRIWSPEKFKCVLVLCCLLRSSMFFSTFSKHLRKKFHSVNYKLIPLGCFSESQMWDK